MRRPMDVQRSLKRYAGHVLQSLPDPESTTALPRPDLSWEIRLDNQIMASPLCIVTQTTPETFSGGRWAVECSMGVRWACYAGQQSTEERAVEVAATISDWFFTGLRRGVALGHPARVPLYDYDGIGLDDPATEDDREPHDFIRVTAVSVQPLLEPEDRRRVTVLVAATATWVRSGPVAEIDTGRPTAASSAVPLIP